MGRPGAPKQKWTTEEEQALRAGVARYGIGKWRLIQKDEEFADILANRSNVDLKDKWRNLNMEAGTSRGDRRAGRIPEASTLALSRNLLGRIQSMAAGTQGRREGNRHKRKRKPERASEGIYPSSNGLHALHAAASRPASGMTTRRHARVHTREDSPDDGEAQPSLSPEDMVVAAIISLADPAGSHAEDVMGYLETHYGDDLPLRASLKGTLRSMVHAGRLERVPEQPSLYRIGGVMKEYRMDADPAEPRPARNAKRRNDLQMAVQAAEAAAAAVREAEAAAEQASRLEAIADCCEAEAAHEQRSLSLPREAMSAPDYEASPQQGRQGVHVMPMSHSTPDLSPLHAHPQAMLRLSSQDASPLLPGMPSAHMPTSAALSILPLDSHNSRHGHNFSALNDFTGVDGMS